MFSIPLNPKLTEEQFERFYNFCLAYKEYIYDIYFTCRMPPFTQDAMGDIFTEQQHVYSMIDTALHIQNTLGISVSATFNNIQVPPTQKNLDMFVHNFKSLYDAGIRSATIPHTHWVATGQIQAAFPELKIKNTILRNVTKPNEIAELAKAGFNYINIDRDLMRDRDTLIRMKKAADKHWVELALLGNEGCLGGCPMMDEHFEFNNSRVDGPAYFNDPISRVSCPKWDIMDPAVPLKTANITPWKDDWLELLDYVDVFKMHGRESPQQLFNTMDIIKRFANGDEFLFDQFVPWLEQTNLKEKPIQAWRHFIKNCKFDCWDCNKCDKLYYARSGEEAHPLIQAVANELVDSVNSEFESTIPGLTSPRVKKLLNALSKHVDTYLEIGSAMGATASAIECKTIHCVDNWKENIQPETDEFILPVNTKQEFDKNITNAIVHDGDLFTIDKSEINNVGLFFYDGPHDLETTRDAVKYYSDCFDDIVIMVFDDANWMGVTAGANDGIMESGYEILYSKNVLNDIEDEGMWWNGLYLVVAQKLDQS